jgi:hypothetical protein
MLKEYNNQTILIMNDTIPLNDDSAIDRGNSLRLLAETSDLDKYYECKNACNNNKDCVFFDFDTANTTCKLYRKEPFKKIDKIDASVCLDYCSNDEKCDYLHHTINNECYLFSRENIKEKSNTHINDLRFDFPIYGINKSKSTITTDIDDCLKKNNNENCIFYENTKRCVPKIFYKKSPGDTTIYINKEPIDKYKSLNKFVGLKSKNRIFIGRIKKIIILIAMLSFIVYFYNYIKNF